MSGSRLPKQAGMAAGMAARLTATLPVSLVLAVCVLAGGCGQKNAAVDFSQTPRDYVAKDYERVYDRWTRHDQAFKDEDVALEVWATFKSWDFREAYIERYAAVYSLSEADETTLRESQRDVARSAYEFHVTAQSTHYKWNDLEKDSSAWRETLVDAAGHEIGPESVKVVKLPGPYEDVFFPARTPFTKTYAIRFAVPPEGAGFAGEKSGALTLRFSSPVGRVELEWRGKS
jgi:hypothetical protein